MVVCRKPLVLAIDVAGVCLIGLALATAWTCFVLPAQREQTALPAAQQFLEQQRRDLETQQSALAGLQSRFTEMEANCARELKRLNLEDGPLMTQIADYCRTFRVQLAGIEPGAVGPSASGRAIRVRVRGSFAGVVAVVRALESASPYLRVAELDISGVVDGQTELCDAGWTLRLPAAPDATPPAGREGTRR
ncbi:hypothetical protein RAS1_38630 [Phycisphaerae bacterium RAS1]|nr:hypothetical protein RAS1_38630 [Phycisphaerae bacterium RAS1]